MVYRTVGKHPLLLTSLPLLLLPPLFAAQSRRLSVLQAYCCSLKGRQLYPAASHCYRMMHC